METEPLFTWTGDNSDIQDFNFLSEYFFEDDCVDLDANKGVLFGNPITTAPDTQHDLSDQEGFSSDEIDKINSTGNSKENGEEKLVRRRERNRDLARQTRLRKKYIVESMQKQLAQLFTENERLQNIVKRKLDYEKSAEILSSCCVKKPSKKMAMSSNQAVDESTLRLMAAIKQSARSFIITDPALPDNPIIFASEGFHELTGYSADEVLGRNCRFMQGPLSDPKQVNEMRRGIMEGNDVSVCIVNYKADGTPFHNKIFIAALRDSKSNVINYVGVQCEILSAKRKSKLDIIIRESTTEEELDFPKPKRGRPRTRDRKDVCSAPSVGSAPSVDSSHSSDLVKDTTLFPTPHASANSVAVRISNYPPRGAGAVGGGTFPSGAKIYDNYSSTNPNNVTMYKSNDAPPMPMHGQWVLPIADGHSRTDAGSSLGVGNTMGVVVKVNGHEYVYSSSGMGIPSKGMASDGQEFSSMPPTATMLSAQYNAHLMHRVYEPAPYVDATKQSCYNNSTNSNSNMYESNLLHNPFVVVRNNGTANTNFGNVYPQNFPHRVVLPGLSSNATNQPTIYREGQDSRERGVLTQREDITTSATRQIAPIGGVLPEGTMYGVSARRGSGGRGY